MKFMIHNTASGKKEEFKPLNPDRIGMYLCGPTVYDYIHIGNARPLVVFDVLYRYLKLRYRDVTYVRNITDVDDKINARAKEEKISIGELTARTKQQFHQDAAALNCLVPTHEPCATDHIDGMIEIITTLIDKGHAYSAEGHVLFEVATMKNYGEFARVSEEQLIAGARVEQAPFKRNPQDFVLWKPSDDAAPGWDSPWGRGRPGWHIECSAMSRHHLSESFDLHLGGQDLIFPHHQNEIAQSGCAFPDAEFARYWMHNGYLLSEGEKMSKSLGNFYTVRELLGEFPGEALRLLLLQSHYRHPLDFTKRRLQEAKAALDKFYGALDTHSEFASDEKHDIPEAMMEALADDLNTPLALSHWHEALHELNRSGSADSYHAVMGGAEVLGLLQEPINNWVRRGVPVGTFSIEEVTIEKRIKQRLEAKKNKDFAKADEIRDKLKQAGIELLDSPDGTTWRRV